jgi:alpha-1,3-rhamnosyl/mannosyltransferase
MACGRAVCASNTSAVPEVADGAAILFDPRSRTDIARSLRDVLIDAELRARLERLGQQRAAHFHWHTTASMTLDVYREVSESRNSAPISAGSASVPIR